MNSQPRDALRSNGERDLFAAALAALMEIRNRAIIACSGDLDVKMQCLDDIKSTAGGILSEAEVSR